eukprot:TRINITY_DN4137_c0_g1_i1.p1 TRINITY_DN4137_c0_g1~~TRINITY_DN4137_c0_g1_i1.p1  ORF type:complete len:1234 (-),score=279.37 TRINITY_DN4137_c0_g1_i1:435-4136(-)
MPADGRRSACKANRWHSARALQAQAKLRAETADRDWPAEMADADEVRSKVAGSRAAQRRLRRKARQQQLQQQQHQQQEEAMKTDQPEEAEAEAEDSETDAAGSATVRERSGFTLQQWKEKSRNEKRALRQRAELAARRIEALLAPGGSRERLEVHPEATGGNEPAGGQKKSQGQRQRERKTSILPEVPPFPMETASPTGAIPDAHAQVQLDPLSESWNTQYSEPDMLQDGEKQLVVVPVDNVDPAWVAAWAASVGGIAWIQPAEQVAAEASFVPTAPDQDGAHWDAESQVSNSSTQGCPGCLDKRQSIELADMVINELTGRIEELEHALQVSRTAQEDAARGAVQVQQTLEEEQALRRSLEDIVMKHLQRHCFEPEGAQGPAEERQQMTRHCVAPEVLQNFDDYVETMLRIDAQEFQSRTCRTAEPKSTEHWGSGRVGLPEAATEEVEDGRLGIQPRSGRVRTRIAKKKNRLMDEAAREVERALDRSDEHSEHQDIEAAEKGIDYEVSGQARQRQFRAEAKHGMQPPMTLYRGGADGNSRLPNVAPPLTVFGTARRRGQDSGGRTTRTGGSAPPAEARPITLYGVSAEAELPARRATSAANSKTRRRYRSADAWIGRKESRQGKAENGKDEEEALEGEADRDGELAAEAYLREYFRQVQAPRLTQDAFGDEVDAEATGRTQDCEEEPRPAKRFQAEAHFGMPPPWRQEEDNDGYSRGRQQYGHYRETAGSSRSPRPRVGDWVCVTCNDLQFARNDACRKCGRPKPAEQAQQRQQQQVEGQPRQRFSEAEEVKVQGFLWRHGLGEEARQVLLYVPANQLDSILESFNPSREGASAPSRAITALKNYTWRFRVIEPQQAQHEDNLQIASGSQSEPGSPQPGIVTGREVQASDYELQMSRSSGHGRSTGSEATQVGSASGTERPLAVQQRQMDLPASGFEMKLSRTSGLLYIARAAGPNGPAEAVFVFEILKSNTARPDHLQAIACLSDLQKDAEVLRARTIGMLSPDPEPQRISVPVSAEPEQESVQPTRLQEQAAAETEPATAADGPPNAPSSASRPAGQAEQVARIGSQRPLTIQTRGPPGMAAAIAVAAHKTKRVCVPLRGGIKQGCIIASICKRKLEGDMSVEDARALRDRLLATGPHEATFTLSETAKQLLATFPQAEAAAVKESLQAAEGRQATPDEDRELDWLLARLQGVGEPKVLLQGLLQLSGAQVAIAGMSFDRAVVERAIETLE